MTLIIAIASVVYGLISVSTADPFDDCPPLNSPENGRLHRIRSAVPTYYVNCKEGYSTTTQFVSCVRGHWNKLNPECVENTKVNQCASLSAPVNGAKHCLGNPYVGNSCTFRCHSGYLLEGDRIRRCQENLEWSGAAVKCVPHTGPVCKAPPLLHHGTVLDCSPSVPLRPGEKCSFQCSLGFVLRGPRELFCRYTGKLTDERGLESYPKCVEVSIVTSKEPPTESPETSEEQPKKDDDEEPPTSPSTPLPTDPCQYQNGGCEQLCKTISGVKRCQCGRGYKIAQDGVSCNPVRRLPPQHRNPCTSSNGGCTQICNNKNGIAYCECEDGYTLAHDKKTCVEEERQPPQRYDPCKYRNGGCMHICTAENDVATCSCKEGYRLAQNGRRCVDINECSIEPLVCPQRCQNTIGSYRCACYPGYRLTRDLKCEDIDECADERLHRCHHVCENTLGSYTCSCLPGYIQIDKAKCEGCRKNSFRSEEDNSCIECPANSHTVSEGKTSITDCLCNPGFEGNPAENIPCEDIDECAVDNFGCSDKCVNTPGSVHCACPPGFELQQDNKTCSDIDECSIKNGGCQGHCENTVGGFICSCPHGYTQSELDRYSCDDVDECAENNGGCSQKCENFLGGFYCSCHEGYRLDSAQKNCIAIHCPRMPTSGETVLSCKMKANSTLPGEKKNNVALPEMEEYQAGTICNFKCPKGFKLDNPGYITCSSDGKWSGTVSQCVALQCPPLKAPENGGILPKSCTKGHVSVKQRCTFFCNPGYELTDKFIFVCKNSLSWSVDDPPKCKPVSKSPFITCPEDIFVDLQLGENSTNITVPRPQTNMENFNIHPEEIRVGKPTVFPSGKTDITFAVTNVFNNETAECKMSVHVLDNEPPTFYSCPEFMEVDGAHAYGVPVTWEEPLVVDNVGVVTLTKSLEPNSTLTPGVHIVEYTAKDAAGNFATCSFEINVTQAQCSDLEDPINGEANCVDWMFGKICEPMCTEGYMRNPEDSQFYTCDDSGLWSPNDVISPCLQYFNATTTGCATGFEFRRRNDTGEAICLECSPGTFWSAASQMCEDQLDENSLVTDQNHSHRIE